MKDKSEMRKMETGKNERGEYNYETFPVNGAYDPLAAMEFY